MRCSLLCWHPTLKASWPAAALRMSSTCTWRSQWSTGSRGIHFSGGDRMNGASSNLPNKQENFFVHHPHQSQVSESSVKFLQFMNAREAVSLESTLNNFVFCTTILCCSIGTTDWFDTFLCKFYLTLFYILLLYKISRSRLLFAFTRDNAEPELLHFVFVWTKLLLKQS